MIARQRGSGNERPDPELVEAWVLAYGGANDETSGLEAASRIAAALLCDYADTLPADAAAELERVIRMALFLNATPAHRAELGASLGLWPQSDGEYRG